MVDPGLDPQSKPLRVLVTGGAGFQGSNLSRRLLQAGHRVTILSTPSDRSRRNIVEFGLSPATIVWGSVTDRDIVEKIVRDHDLVFHLAANVHVDESIAEPEKFLRTNVLGTHYVLEECRRWRTPLIHVSTCEVYGGCESCECCKFCDRRIHEYCPLKPQSPYAASKAGADCLAIAYARTYDMRVLIVRPGNVFGPGQRDGARGAVIPIFVRQALAGQPITVYGDGSQSRSFIYIKDLMQAYLHLMGLFLQKRTRHLVYNVGTDRSVTVLQIASLVKKLTRSPAPIEHKPPRAGEVRGFRLHSEFLSEGGFDFHYGFEEGLGEYIEWFAANEL